MDYQQSIQENIQLNRDTTKRIIERYYLMKYQEQEDKENQLLWRAQEHLKQRLVFWTEFVREGMYDAEGYVRFVLRDLLFSNPDIYPYAWSINGEGPYWPDCKFLIDTGVRWYNEHLKFPPWESTISGKEEKDRRKIKQLSLL